jgi:hypothetical protein
MERFVVSHVSGVGARRRTALTCLTTNLLFAFSVFAQREPRIAYVYPAGGRQGTTFEVVVGGQYLNHATNAFVSGAGVSARVLTQEQPPTPKESQALRDEIGKLQEKRRNGERWSPEETRRAEEIRKKLAAFERKRANPALGEFVTLRVTVAPTAAPGPREIRLGTLAGLSNPRVFCVGQLPEFSEADWKNTPRRRAGPQPDRSEPSDTFVTLPATLNGQITPGGVDRYRFAARAGQSLVIAASARALIPYLADAVPGWFQATLTLYNATGKELAYDDDFRLQPDPVLFYKIPSDGEYVLEIKDALYRGREDFVYRVSVGELPFVTGIFPLGRRAGDQTAFEVRGWNLASAQLAPSITGTNGGTFPFSVRRQDWISNEVPFDVDTLPECWERGPNQFVQLPVIVNGRIDRPGEDDVFRFEGHAGEEVVAEVLARRLGSPLDSMLRLTDATGRQWALNDDCEDRRCGLNTHHADSYLRVKLPADGAYFLRLSDAQRNGGSAYAYRLRLSAPRPDFALRVVPSSVNARAGGSATLTVYALRRDGCTNEIKLALRSAPDGFKLTGPSLTGTQEQVRVTLKVPATPPPEPVTLVLEGRALIGDREVVHAAVPADDMMQAFIYRHLVPAQEWKVAVTEGRRPR